MDPAPTILRVGRGVAASAYLLATATTLLWVACSLPAGVGGFASDRSDATTPIRREAILLAPALLLLVLLPVGMALARRARGALAILAATDAFVAIYAAVALGTAPIRSDPAVRILFGLLLLLGLISAIEAWRCGRPTERPLRLPAMKGLRLAVCLIVLMTPPDLLLAEHRERASLLAPFALVAIGAGGALIVRALAALRAVSGLVQLLVAAHVVVTLRFTLIDGEPRVGELGPAGRASLALAIAVAALALLHWVALLVSARRRTTT